MTKIAQIACCGAAQNAPKKTCSELFQPGVSESRVNAFIDDLLDLGPTNMDPVFDGVSEAEEPPLTGVFTVLR